MKKLWLLLAVVCLVAAPAVAQQTGSISGKVSSPDGGALPGVTVEATSNVLPQTLVTTTGADGEYRFPFVPPGEYTLTYSLQGMATETRTFTVQLAANSRINVSVAPEAIEEAIEVVGNTTLIDTTSTELKNGISNETIEALPVGQEYRDLQKLIPGVQYSEQAIRGPSAGGSGQDNVYLYDGVNVSLPLFGTLSAEPSSHDIDQVTVIKGGAKAQDFNRSAGFTINSVSKSGTNQFHGEVEYRLQSAGMTGAQDVATTSKYDEDRDWSTVAIGGPIVADKLNFYASYYRPSSSRSNASNAYGEVPGYEYTRDEFFGRLSFQPTPSVLLHGSYRHSDATAKNASIGSFSTPSTSVGSEAQLKIAILEGSWMINNNNFATFKFTDFANPTFGGPDNLLGFSPAGDGSVPLNIADLASQGRLTVPTPRSGETAYNNFIQPYIDQYGYVSGGVKVGGGAVGADDEINDQDFYRTNYQAGYNWLFGSDTTHELHFGYQTYKDEEDLDRYSNGWGTINIPGGRISSSGEPVYFQARVLQTGVTGLPGGQAPVIHSEFKSQNVEINDTIRKGKWSFNVGVLLSNDELYGQGLKENKSNVSGYELCLTCKYKMYEVKWSDQLQPRLGAVWAYNGSDTVYASYSRYNPAASSLPRAASWARNLASIRTANFDASGNLIDIQALASSTGKFFQPDLTPRSTDEFVLGTSKQLSSSWVGRLTGRYRNSLHFWEDTNNNARSYANAPANIPHTDYIPELADYRAEVGGSSYVIAELDNAFTKYYELSAEFEFRGRKTRMTGSYVWSHYYGNFDQDNTNGDPIDNDYNSFIGSSNIADGPGRQLWDFKYGNFHGDRRHQFKVFGYYLFDWNASAGAYAVYQSGQPWETWNVEYYRALTSSTSNTIRFSEPAGSRTSDPHYQLDLNYTQNFELGGRYGIQLRADLYNVFDKQTGYAIQPVETSSNYGNPTAYFAPRKFQLSARFSF